MKKILALVLAMVLALSVVLTGCGGGTSDQSSGGNESGGGSQASGDVAWDTSKQDTIVASVMNNYYTAGWKQMAEDYMALHPETEVVTTWLRTTIPIPRR